MRLTLRYLSDFFRRDPFSRNCFIFGAVLWLTMSGLLMSTLGVFQEKGELLTLHYNVFFGIDDVGSWSNLILIPITGALILIINLGFAAKINDRFPEIARVLVLGATSANALLLIATAVIRVANI